MTMCHFLSLCSRSWNEFTFILVNKQFFLSQSRWFYSTDHLKKIHNCYLSKIQVKIWKWPQIAASWNGVLPLWSFGFLFSAFSLISLYKSKCPFITAWCSGVDPSESFGFASLTDSMIILQIFSQPLEAASWSGVLPWISFGSGVNISQKELRWPQGIV